MNSRLQLDVRNLSLGKRRLVNPYQVKAGIDVIAGNTVWSLPERLACTTKISRYISTLNFYLLHIPFDPRNNKKLNYC